MLGTNLLRYARLGWVLLLSGLILGGVFAVLEGQALPAAAQPAPRSSGAAALNPTFTAAGIVISQTPTGEVFFNNSHPGVLTLTFTLTGTPPLTLTAEPAFGTRHVLTSPVAPWEAVLSYTVGVTAVSQPHMVYTLTQDATVPETLAVITYTRDITSPQMSPLGIDLLDSGMYVDGAAVYYTHTTPGDVFFTLRGSVTDTLSGPGSVLATSALGTANPSNSSGNWKNWLFVYRIPSGIAETGRIIVTATDAVSNAAHLFYDYRHDPEPPTGTVQIANGAAYISATEVSLQLTANDGEGCGVAQMCLSNTPECYDWSPFATTVTGWELSAGDGEKFVYARYRDHLGNTSALIPADPIRLDTKLPTVTVTAPARVAVPRIEVSWTAEDKGGLRPTLLYTVAFRQDAGAWVTPTWLTNTPLTKTTFTSPIVQLDHTYTFRVTAKDRAGNTGTGTAVTRVEMYRVYLPLTLRSWVWWYANDLYEPNNTPAEAWGPLVSGQSIQAYIWDATDSNDYYHFTPSTAGNVVVTLSNIPSNVDYDLYIYYYENGTYKLAGKSNYPGQPTEQANFVGQAGRQYFVRVYRYSGYDSTTQYSLVATYP